jgi:acetyltransferase
VHGDPIRFLRGLAAIPPAPRPTGAVETAGTLPSDEALTATPLDFVPKGGRRALDEWSTLDLLSRAELPTPLRARVSDSETVGRAADSVGFPCVLKMLRPFVPHRSRIGAVVTGIESADALQSAWEEMRASHRAEAAIVEAEVPPGLEVIVGVMADASFGARMSISAGGVRVDDVSQRVTLIPPFDPRLVEEEISGLDLWDMARLARTTPEEARSVVAMAASRIGQLFMAMGHELEEIECNPVIVNAHGATVVDALAFGKDVD